MTPVFPVGNISQPRWGTQAEDQGDESGEIHLDTLHCGTAMARCFTSSWLRKTAAPRRGLNQKIDKITLRKRRRREERRRGEEGREEKEAEVSVLANH